MSSPEAYSHMIAGISRKSQELTAIFLGIRLYCRRAAAGARWGAAALGDVHDKTPCLPRARS